MGPLVGAKLYVYNFNGRVIVRLKGGCYVGKVTLLFVKCVGFDSQS